MFIKIKNRILDKNKLREQQLIVRNHIILSIYDILSIHGFVKNREGFIHKDLNMKMELKFGKAEEEIRI